MQKALTYHKTEIVELQSPDCSYNIHKWIPNKETHTCFVRNQIIEPGKSLVFPKFNVLFMDLKKGVRALEFVDCKLFEVPNRLSETFGYLETLSIRNCFLKEIKRAELSEFRHLRQLFIISNEITHLAADLFNDLKQLEAISFYQNKISIIEPGLLDSLGNLKFADFRQNININTCLAASPYTHPMGDNYTRISTLNNLIALIALDCAKMKNVKKTKGTGLTEDIQKFIPIESFKDLTINAGGAQFRVHKFLMAARSPKLASMLLENQNARELTLTEISSEVFADVLDFICHEKFPSDEMNLMEIYEAAGKLQINELKNFCAEELMEVINDENALDILLMSNKYENHELKMKSFEAIKKMFPDKKFKNELADDPETIKKMLFVRQKLEKEFENLGIYE